MTTVSKSRVRHQDNSRGGGNLGTLIKATLAAVALVSLPVPLLSSYAPLVLSFTLDRLHLTLVQLVSLTLLPTLWSLFYPISNTDGYQQSARISVSTTTATATKAATKAALPLTSRGDVKAKGDESAPQTPIPTKRTLKSPALKEKRRRGEEIAKECDSMISKLTEILGTPTLCTPSGKLITNSECSSKIGEWERVVDQEEPIKLRVWRNVNHSFMFKVEAILSNVSAANMIDLVANLDRRLEWDVMCDEAKFIHHLDHSTKVLYLKMKPVWPTSARDLCLMAHLRQITNGSKDSNSDTEPHIKYVNVTKSTTHPECPTRDAEGIVRMEAGLAGQIVFPLADAPESSSVIMQLFDGDPKGWIPASVVKFVSGSVVPKMINRVNKIASSEDQIQESKLIARIEANKAADTETNEEDILNEEEAAEEAADDETAEFLEDGETAAERIERLESEVAALQLRNEELTRRQRERRSRSEHHHKNKGLVSRLQSIFTSRWARFGLQASVPLFIAAIWAVWTGRIKWKRANRK
ncbi:Bet v1-like protein [Ramicandelaber brevisporus]|nr:Bet v1-like protein [Ramicandelaber brevisporus]